MIDRLAWMLAMVVHAAGWVLAAICVLAIIINGEQVAAAAWIGLACGVGAAVYARSIARELEGDPWWR